MRQHPEIRVVVYIHCVIGLYYMCIIIISLKTHFYDMIKYYSLVDNNMVNTKMVDKIMNTIKFQKCLNKIYYILGSIHVH